ncbi:gluconate 2-dehydrogenase subunit 3 family protein [Novosphingobium sp. B 225]|uniref:gluconate 2-dehydrogenase subunit 3 family protein n=1 Tax=Novosphingobium sp. B 225 TaxID=1961849 RepID=UPI000B4BC240|nr:gluconate 2-dehydrogenase subunit 3 family protein [Novosphingobium sp. B 225]
MMQELLAMDRRGLMARALVLLGASALPGCKELGGSAAWKELSAEHFKLLTAFADTLIPQTDTPGAVAAGVPKVLTQMYHDWASDETREALTGALDRIDAGARKAKEKGFTELTPAERQTFLAAHDKAALVEVPPPSDAPKGNPFVPPVSVADNGYHKLKELTAVTYYTTQAALTTELAYEHVPGGWTSSVKVTPKTRPAVTFGAF